MITLQNEEIAFEFSELFKNDYSRVWVSPHLKTIICEATSHYIPIEDFKLTFNACTEFIKQQEVNKFIFDKRSLTSFHQPSMEWYFLTWKKDVLNYGLSAHRKVLPPLDWFKECVDACKSQMLANKEHLFLNEIDLQYFDSVKECVEN